MRYDGVGIFIYLYGWSSYCFDLKFERMVVLFWFEFRYLFSIFNI